MVNPIVDWTDEDVWEYLNDVVKVEHCCLYDEGITRIGCIGCPLAGAEKMRRDFERYPKYKENYIRAFDRMIKNHPGEIRIATGEVAESGGVETKHGSSGADMVDEQKTVQLESDSGGGGYIEPTGDLMMEAWLEQMDSRLTGKRTIVWYAVTPRNFSINGSFSSKEDK
jgi:3'-phosphoadenosine 5'-phosphosulfate sulfotransferase (PAPS reductase)/FAD synthetase